MVVCGSHALVVRHGSHRLRGIRHDYAGLGYRPDYGFGGIVPHSSRHHLCHQCKRIDCPHSGERC